MHVISRKALREFWREHADAKAPLTRWYKIVSKSEWEDFVQLRATFPSADMVNDLIVFNVGGNNYRLIASIHFNRGKLYIRHILSHAEYDRGNWKK
jgi:mRNA interferase HigB